MGKVGRAVYGGAITLVLLLFVVLLIFPFLWMLSSSFKQGEEIFSYPPALIPKEWRLENYSYLFTRIQFLRYATNSAIVSLTYVILSLLFSSMGGFAFAKYDFPWRAFLLTVLLGSMMIPGQIVLVPLFLQMVRLGWVDTYNALIIPFCANAFGVFLMRQYMVSIPSELLDAARIDGAGEFRIYRTMALPLARPALGTLALIDFMSSWNSFLWPLIVLRSDRMYTIPIGLANLLGIYMGQQQQWGPLMAGAFLSTLPLIILFVVAQEQFLAGLTMGSVKG